MDVFEADGHSHSRKDPYRHDERAWVQTHRGYIMHKLKEWRHNPSAQIFWHSSSTFDSFLIAAAAQVGQVLVVFPQCVAQMGYGWGVFFLVMYALLGCWTVFLLTWLYLEYKMLNHRESRELPMGHILQYHEVIHGVAGKYAGILTFFLNMAGLTMASVIQLIASASNLYYLNSHFNKRDWQIVVGVLSLSSVFMPGFKHFRAAAFIGLLTTTITAVYLVVASRTNGQEYGITHNGPKSTVNFFDSATIILFAFGGHGISVEMMESMHTPENFRFSYPFAVLYTLVLSIASSMSVYWAYGDDLLDQHNALGVLPASHWKHFAIFCMFVHQSIAFVIYIYPVFLVAEKITRVHTQRFRKRVLARLPVVLFVWFVAMALPFLGPLNAVVGSLLISIGIYFMPLISFYWTYRDRDAQKESVLKLPLWLPSWGIVFFVNAVIMVWIVVVCCGIGAWATMTRFVRDVHTYGFFQKCFEC